MENSEKRAQLKQIIQENSYQENHEKPFLLASGISSPYYLDLKQILFVPEYLHLFCEVLLNKIITVLETSVVGVAGLTMGADPLVYGISLAGYQKKNFVVPLIVRKEKKNHGSKKKIEGRLDKLHPNIPIVLVDDVVTTGGSIIKTHEALQESGFSSKFAFCLVDRSGGCHANFKNKGIQLCSLFELKEFKKKID